MNNKKMFLDAAGVKTEAQFYKKYPTPESFFRDYPQAQNGVTFSAQQHVTPVNYPYQPTQNVGFNTVDPYFSQFTRQNAPLYAAPGSLQQNTVRYDQFGNVMPALEMDIYQKASGVADQMQKNNKSFNNKIKKQDGGEVPPQEQPQQQMSEEVVQIVQLYAQLIGASPEEVMAELQQAPPEQQQQLIEQMLVEVQAASQQGQEQQAQPIQQQAPMQPQAQYGATMQDYVGAQARNFNFNPWLYSVGDQFNASPNEVAQLRAMGYNLDVLK